MVPKALRSGVLAAIAFALLTLVAQKASRSDVSANATAHACGEPRFQQTSPFAQHQKWANEHTSLRHEMRGGRSADRRTPDPMPNYGLWVSWTRIQLEFDLPKAPSEGDALASIAVCGQPLSSGRTTRGPPA